MNVRTLHLSLIWLALAGSIVVQAQASAEAFPISVFQLEVPAKDLEFVDPNDLERPVMSRDPLFLQTVRLCDQFGFCANDKGSQVGTGFLFISNRRLATAWHSFRAFLNRGWTTVPLVIRDLDGRVVFGDRKNDSTQIIFADSERDILVLELNRPLKGIAVKRTAEAVEGDVVSIAGFCDHASDIKLHSDGGQIVSIANGSNQDIANYQGCPGLSGAPVLNKEGLLLGIHRGILVGDPNSAVFTSSSGLPVR